MPFLHPSRFALCLALLFALAQTAGALQLGETHAQLTARHGPPNDEDHARNLATYFWDGWSAQLEFRGGAVSRITYKRNWYLQEQEITSLLEANGGAGHWTEISGPSDKNRLWARDDGAAASCTRLRPLTIVFESGLESGAPPAGPKAATPATSGPATNQVAGSSRPTAVLPEPDGAPPTTSDSSPAKSSVAAPIPPAQPTATAPEPTHPLASKPEPTRERQSITPTLTAHDLASALGAGALLALAGTGIYLLKRRPRSVGTRSPAHFGPPGPPALVGSSRELRNLPPDPSE